MSEALPYGHVTIMGPFFAPLLPTSELRPKSSYSYVSYAQVGMGVPCTGRVRPEVQTLTGHIYILFISVFY